MVCLNGYGKTSAADLETAVERMKRLHGAHKRGK